MFDIGFKESLKNGKPEAYKELFRLLYPRLKGYCKLFVHNGNDVEDILQDCFLSLWEKRFSIIVEKSIESYLFMILRNRCLNYLKDLKLKEEIVKTGVTEISELQYLYQLDFLEKEEKSIEEQLVIALEKAVDLLPRQMKQVFIQCKIKGRKQKETQKWQRNWGLASKPLKSIFLPQKNRLVINWSGNSPFGLPLFYFGLSKGRGGFFR